MISFYNTYEGFEVAHEDLLEKTIQAIADDFGLIIEYINIILLTDDGLLEINKEFLSHDYYTDIITFNYSETEGTLESELYISIDRVKENATVERVEEQVELSRVIIHGMLHLAGYEDDTPVRKAEMRSMEDKYLNTAPFHVKPA